MTKQPHKTPSISIGFKLSLSLVSIVSLITITTSIILFSLVTLKSNKDFNQKTNNLLLHSKKDLLAPLCNLNDPLIERICKEHIKTEEIVLLKVLDHKNRLIFKNGEIKDTDFIKETNIIHKDETIGSIIIGFSHKTYNSKNRNLLFFSFIILFFLILGLSMSTGLVVQKPMELMLNRIEKFKDGQYEIVLTDIEYTEIQNVLTAFNQMGMDIKNRENLLKSEIVERQKKECQYRLLAENMEDVAWTIDPSKKITYISPSVTQLLGYTQEEAMKKPLGEKNISEGYQALDQNLTYAMERGAPFIIEYKQPCKDGSTVWVESHIKPLFDKLGNPIEFIGVSRNISLRKDAESKQKRLEKQLYQAQKMEAIGMLASGISHDFNNILAGILGFSQLLLEDLRSMGDTGKMERWTNNVIDCSLRAKDLVAQILAFTRSHEESIYPVNLQIIVKKAI